MVKIEVRQRLRDLIIVILMFACIFNQRIEIGIVMLAGKFLNKNQFEFCRMEFCMSSAWMIKYTWKMDILGRRPNGNPSILLVVYWFCWGRSRHCKYINHFEKLPEFISSLLLFYHPFFHFLFFFFFFVNIIMSVACAYIHVYELCAMFNFVSQTTSPMECVSNRNEWILKRV